MEEKINQINLSIEEKQVRLKEKAERYFASIVIPSTVSSKQSLVNKNSNVPPISYILYGVAGLSVIGALVTTSKLLCLGVATASAIGGYKLSKTNNRSSTYTNDSISINISSVKTEVTSKVIESVKKITNDWEEFMEIKQKEVQIAISSSQLNENEKNSLSSKVFLYEIINISISNFSSLLKTVTQSSEIKQCLDSYKAMLLTAIDSAVKKQISKYNSLLNK